MIRSQDVRLGGCMDRRVVVAWAIWLLSWSPAAVVHAQSGERASEPAAREAFERGRAFYDSGAFEEASAAFEEAYRLSGRDALLYNLYLAYRDANEQEKAAQALRSYLQKVPQIENRAQLEARLAALEQGLARERARREAQAQAQAQAQTPSASAAPAGPESAVEAGGAAEPAAPSAASAPVGSARAIAGITLASVGAGMLATSIATGVLASRRAQKLEDRCMEKVCDPSLKDTAESGKRLAHATDALLFGGLAVAATGTVLFLLARRDLREDSARAGPRLRAACWRDGCRAEAALWF